MNQTVEGRGRHCLWMLLVLPSLTQEWGRGKKKKEEALEGEVQAIERKENLPFSATLSAVSKLLVLNQFPRVISSLESNSINTAASKDEA